LDISGTKITTLENLENLNNLKTILVTKNQIKKISPVTYEKLKSNETKINHQSIDDFIKKNYIKFVEYKK